MTVIDDARLGGQVSDEVRARWVDVAEVLRAEPELLPYIKKVEPGLYADITKGLRALAIVARHEEWRDPEPGVGGRPEQLIPGTPGSFSDRVDWLVWLLMGGRGSGKTRTGAEAVGELTLGREWRERPFIGLIGQTLDDVRTTMVENTLLEVLPPGSVQKWNRNQCELWLSNGAYMKGYSSENPRKLRGPNFHLVWGDELATWADADRSPNATDTTFSNAKLALRAMDGGTWTPRFIATTTPKSVRLIRNMETSDPGDPGEGLYDDPLTVVSHMSTMDNVDNLAPHFFTSVIEPLIGTRLYKQEVEGELVDEVLGAQWSTELIDQMRYPTLWPERQGQGLKRAVVAVDPSIGEGLGDECGIVVSGLAYDGNAYGLDDMSMRGSAKQWVDVVVRAFNKWGCSVVVVEKNQGGELVREAMGRYAPNLPIKDIWAKKGKMLRAEPVALLSDKGRVRLAGEFPLLERQMRTWDGSGDSPDRLDAFVYSMLELLPVETGAGELVSFMGRMPRR